MPEAPLRIFGFAGSLRKASYNRGLLRLAQASAPEGVEIETIELNDIPPFNQDVEEAGDPEPVRKLKERVAAADALLIVTPEYNGAMPGLLKNTLDWLSRVPRNTVLRTKTAAIMGASAGGRGSLPAQAQVRRLLDIFGCPVMEEPVVAIARAGDRFDDRGDLIDDALREEVAAFVAAFVKWTIEVRSDEAAASG